MLTIDEASPWTIVGVDCASQDAHIGLARGTLSSAGLTLEQVQIGGRETSVARWIAACLQGPRVLLAIDAPLGWPRPLAEALKSHRAGQPIAGAVTYLMRRETDRQVAATLGKTPLDVAADRIAYAAHRALRLLGELRELTGQPIPLLWQPAPGVGAIEVYPAATLRACSIDASGYKNKTSAHRDTARDARARLLMCLQTRLTVSRELSDVILAAKREDMLDAAVCVLAGADFIKGHCAPPTPAELPIAQQEGWIWYRRPTTAT